MNARPAHHACAAASAEEALDEAPRRAFLQSLHRAPLPALSALETAARTLGALYRQVAQAHEGPGGCGCGCGCEWKCKCSRDEKNPTDRKRKGRRSDK